MKYIFLFIYIIFLISPFNGYGLSEFQNMKQKYFLNFLEGSFPSPAIDDAVCGEYLTLLLQNHSKTCGDLIVSNFEITVPYSDSVRCAFVLFQSMWEDILKQLVDNKYVLRVNFKTQFPLTPLHFETVEDFRNFFKKRYPNMAVTAIDASSERVNTLRSLLSVAKEVVSEYSAPSEDFFDQAQQSIYETVCKNYNQFQSILMKDPFDGESTATYLLESLDEIERWNIIFKATQINQDSEKTVWSCLMVRL